MRVCAVIIACLMHGVVLWSMIASSQSPSFSEPVFSFNVSWLPPVSSHAYAAGSLSISDSAASDTVSAVAQQQKTAQAEAIVPEARPQTDNKIITTAVEHNESSFSLAPTAVLPEKTEKKLSVQKKPPAEKKTGVAKTQGRDTKNQVKQIQRIQNRGVASGTGNGGISSAAGFTGGGGMATIVQGIQKCYPKISQKRGEEGVAEIQVTIGPNNNLQAAVIKKSTGYPRLDECALTAVRGGRYKSAVKNGVPVSSQITLPPIRFEIKRK